MKTFKPTFAVPVVAGKESDPVAVVHRVANWALGARVAPVLNQPLCQHGQSAESPR